MNRGKLSVVIVMLAVAALACGLPSLPSAETQLKSGPVQTQAISVPLPADTSKPVEVILRLGAAEVTASTGSAKLIEGSVQYNVQEFQPTVNTTGSKVEVLQGSTGGVQGVPPKDMVNKWNLRFGGGAPMNLTVQAGAYSGTWNLGGLRLQSLTWEEGASKSTIGFGQASLDKMDVFNFTTGASTVKLTGLANLNFGKMNFQSGVGTYTLDFGGKLKRSASVEIKTGISNLTVVVPVGTAARITLKSAVSNTKTVGSWNNVGSVYTAGKYDTAAEKLDVNIDMGLGQLTLDTH
jgi:hypothetical protein